MVAHEGHDTAVSSVDAGGMDMGTSSHGSMAMSFFMATNTPLYSEAWTPTTAGQYAGTCIFLIFLSVFLRAVLTAKAFLEVRAVKSALKRRYVVVAGEKAVVDKATDDVNSMTGILTTNGIQEDVRVISAPVSHIQPWRFSVDLPRALIMTVAAGLGYLLMLAAMTYNVGYFLSVLAGAFVGELAFGRFNQVAAH